MADVFSPNLLIKHLQPSPSQPDIPVNVAWDTLDLAFTGMLSKTVTVANVTLTSTEFIQSYFHRISGALTADRSYIVPVVKRPFTVEHGGTAHNLLVKTPSGTGITLVPGSVQSLYCDGTNVVPRGPATTATGSPFVLGSFRQGRPGANDLVLITDILIPLSLPSGLTGSRAKARTATTADATFDIRQNGVSKGSFTITAGNQVGTFTFASPVSLAVNDDVTVVAPAVQDATLANLSVSLLAYRT